MKRYMTLFLILILGIMLVLIPATLAQEATPEITPEVTEEPEMTPEVTPEMTPEMTSEVTPEITPEVTDEPEMTPEMTPEATVEPVLPGDTDVYLRFAHFAPEVEGVDIFVDGRAIDETDLAYLDITDWMLVDAGTYDFDVVSTGDTANDAIISLDDVNIGPGFVTVFIILGEDNQLTSFLARTDNEVELAPATSGLTLVNALSADTSVNFDRNDVPFVTELSANGNRALYTPVDSDVYTFRVYDPFANSNDETREVSLDLTTEVELSDGSYYLIAIVGTENDPQLIVHETTGAEFAILNGTLDAPGTLNEAIASHESLVLYTDIIETVELTENFGSEGPYTLFLPADYLLDELQALGEATDFTLIGVLQDHVLEGNIPLSQLMDMDSITTLAGNTYEVTFEGNAIYVGGARILNANIYATNGVIYIIDGILTPIDDTE